MISVMTLMCQLEEGSTPAWDVEFTLNYFCSVEPNNFRLVPISALMWPPASFDSFGNFLQRVSFYNFNPGTQPPESNLYPS